MPPHRLNASHFAKHGSIIEIAIVVYREEER